MPLHRYGILSTLVISSNGRLSLVIVELCLHSQQLKPTEASFHKDSLISHEKCVLYSLLNA